jgi:hypothetical protein
MFYRGLKSAPSVAIDLVDIHWSQVNVLKPNLLEGSGKSQENFINLFFQPILGQISIIVIAQTKVLNKYSSRSYVFLPVVDLQSLPLNNGILQKEIFPVQLSPS